MEQNRQLAFLDIDCAVVEYPLLLLQQGVKIVDSPGLNDTEAPSTNYHRYFCRQLPQFTRSRRSKKIL